MKEMTMADAIIKGGTLFGDGLSTEYNLARGRNSMQDRAAFALSKVPRVQELAITLNGEAAGGAALKQRARVEAASGVALGGVRVIETVDIVNRATTSADETELDANLFAFTKHDASPPADGNGNPTGKPGLR